jgi:hypothetical protein
MKEALAKSSRKTANNLRSDNIPYQSSYSLSPSLLVAVDIAKYLADVSMETTPNTDSDPVNFQSQIPDIPMSLGELCSDSELHKTKSASLSPTSILNDYLLNAAKIALHYEHNKSLSPKDSNYADRPIRMKTCRKQPGSHKKAHHINDRDLMDISDGDVVSSLELVPRHGKEHSFATKEFLIRWLFRYRNNPYPSIRIKQKLATKSNLTVKQIEDFFVNGAKYF